jgi:hypothetical protein
MRRWIERTAAALLLVAGAAGLWFASDAAQACSAGEITALESDLGNMFDQLVEKLARGGLKESEISTALLVFNHLSDVLTERRHVLAAAGAIPSAVAMPPARMPA